jgi:hypothetical protein
MTLGAVSLARIVAQLLDAQGGSNARKLQQHPAFGAPSLRHFLPFTLLICDEAYRSI